MTEQEIFDIVSTHLLTQGGKSRTGEHPCAYRGENGWKCAAGVLIPDDLYQPMFEGKLWSKVCEVSPELRAIGHRNLIIALQRIHDLGEPISWADRLRELARGRGLSTAVIDKLEIDLRWPRFR